MFLVNQETCNSRAVPTIVLDKCVRIKRCERPNRHNFKIHEPSTRTKNRPNDEPNWQAWAQRERNKRARRDVRKRHRNGFYVELGERGKNAEEVTGERVCLTSNELSISGGLMSKHIIQQSPCEMYESRTTLDQSSRCRVSCVSLSSGPRKKTKRQRASMRSLKHFLSSFHFNSD